jgi:hypothetical protein
MARPRFHWFAYYASPWEMKEFFRKGEFDVSRVIHQTRDTMAFAELASALASLGCRYGGPILNLPEDLYKKKPQAPEPLSDLKSGDLLVQVTRPPLQENYIPRAIHKGTSKERQVNVGPVVPKSGLDLERAIADALQEHFLVSCTREGIDLSPGLVALLHASRRHRRYGSVDFRSKNSACYKPSWVRENKLGDKFLQRTAGYIAFIPNLPGEFSSQSGLIVWAQAGYEALYLAWSLRHKFMTCLRQIIRDHPKQFHFAMVEWTVPHLHARPTGLQAFKGTDPAFRPKPRLLFHAMRDSAPEAVWRFAT